MTDNKLKTALLVNICSLLVFSGCSNEHKVVHKLDCVVHSVVNAKTGKETVFKREDAIKNGFEYFFKVYDDGSLSVNDTDIYVQDKASKESYFLKREHRVDENMKFVFNDRFDDVVFKIVDQGIEYHYECQ